MQVVDNGMAAALGNRCWLSLRPDKVSSITIIPMLRIKYMFSYGVRARTWLY